MNITSLNWISW